jgi:hypothetical protein
VSGSARVEGIGSTALVVTGDLVIASGAGLTGWLWVGGDLTLQGGARVTGLADVGGNVRLEGDAVLDVDRCAAAAVLATAPDLLRPWGVGPLAWPAF